MRRVLLALIVGSAAAWAEDSFARDIAPILAAKCGQCHRPKDIAPFAVGTYEAVEAWKDDIKRVLVDGTMPPWKPVAGFGEFRGDFSLTAEEKQRIIAWIDAGAPLGDPADLPAPPEETEWSLGQPDLTLTMAEPYEPPRGRDMYRCFVLPTDFATTKFISAVDILPGDRRYVHHVILYVDPTGESEQLDAKEPGPGYTCFGGPGTEISAADVLGGNSLSLGGWAPGTRASHLPQGVGMQLPSKARIVMQVHYYARGGTAPDQTRVGLYFNKTTVERRLLFVPVVPLDSRGRVDMTIPAGAADHTITTEFLVPPFYDAKLVNIFPHMHLLGRKIKADLIGLDGRVAAPLVYIDNWDFNWQGPYTYNSEVSLRALQRVRLACTYDNSVNNPRNPNNPVKTVRWGEGTEDEMCLVFLGLTFDRDRLSFNPAP
jgi:hypothetical protein